MREPWDPAPAFWIWNQTLPFSPDPSGRSYLQVAEFTTTSHQDLQKSPYPANAIPVVRLPPGRATLEDPAFEHRFLSWARKSLEGSSPKHLQLDYDCSTMGLAHYAQFLAKLRKELDLTSLSITALASWIDAPGFRDLCQSVDELAPMFYDLESDKAADILANSPLAMVDGSTLSWITKWQKCPTTWRAGLANFQRLSLFQANGELIGHLQRWTPAHLQLIPGLTQLPQKFNDSLTYQITRNIQYEGVEMKPGQLLVWRCPDEAFTRRALTTAQSSGASGILWFAHPDSAPVAWHSISHLSALQSGQTPLVSLLHQFLPNGSVSLTNQGPGDLPFHPWAKPWQLVLEASSTGTFAPSDPGTFQEIAAPGSSLARPELARTITLSFPELRSGQSLTSGQSLINSSTAPAPSVRIHPKPPTP